MENRARIALMFTCALDFAKGLLQTLGQNQIPVLLPNLNSGTLEKLKSEYDSVLSTVDETFAVDLKDLDRTLPLVFYTSGSTGEPKKVVKTLDHLLNEVEVIERFFGHMARGPIYSTVSHQHIYGLLFSVLWPLYSKRTVGNFLVTFPEQLSELEKRFSDFVLISSPSFLSRLDNLQLSGSCSLITSSGAPLDFHTAQATAKVLGQTPYEIFGSTETGGVAWRQQSSANSSGIWTPVEKVSIRLDENSQLLVRSPFFSEPELQMGDQAIRKDEGQFLLLGRADRIVKIEGKRVSLAEIENEIMKSGLVVDVVALQERTYRDQVSVALVLSSLGKEIWLKSEKELKQIIRQRLSLVLDHVSLPKKIRVVDLLPRNSEHKINRIAVEELLNA